MPKVIVADAIPRTAKRLADFLESTFREELEEEVLFTREIPRETWIRPAKVCGLITKNKDAFILDVKFYWSNTTRAVRFIVYDKKYFDDAEYVATLLAKELKKEQIKWEIVVLRDW